MTICNNLQRKWGGHIFGGGCILERLWYVNGIALYYVDTHFIIQTLNIMHTFTVNVHYRSLLGSNSSFQFHKKGAEP